MKKLSLVPKMLRIQKQQENGPHEWVSWLPWGRGGQEAGRCAETSEPGGLVQGEACILPCLCTTAALWKKLGPCGPQTYGVLSVEAGPQEA